MGGWKDGWMDGPTMDDEWVGGCHVQGTMRRTDQWGSAFSQDDHQLALC